ncbi:hypothetical protein RJ639_015608 [Escallonia herrerae]|uniref:AAA+ ATPase domain-containing protein n=1 Tax=Escallonia herrerae TaxID=1293975 RepID=A0AA88VGX9_9ASTE|nr:hypothetical protein RJ639_015608 [Escallonia herrerae]
MAIDAIVAIAAKIGEYTIAPIGRQLGYLIHYDRNITSLREQASVLEKHGAGVQGLVEAAARKGEIVLPNVQGWLTSADEVCEDCRGFITEQVKEHQKCADRLFLDFKSRYRISREAKERRLRVDQLLRDGVFDRVSYPAPPPKVGSSFEGDWEVFESRSSVFEEIMEALEDDKLGVVGVYGMAGVGKTTLVKGVVKQAEECKLFDEIVMAVVSQVPIVRNIQGEIADELGLKFEEESDSGRARRLCERLKQVKRLLAVLDDLWTVIDLEAIGIPYGDAHKGCKIVLTSRNQDVCNEMNCLVNFPIKVLPDSDAWKLFRKMAGAIVDTPDLQPIATNIAKRCAGLPIAIATVARALKSKSAHAWSDALHQLQNSTPKNIKGMHANVYSPLELSYNFLETNELKSCFLLCSIFNKEVDIPVEHLMRYGMGLRLFENVQKLEDARNRARTLVDTLKACCLLLDGKSVDSFRMHDVIRDFAILVAWNGERVLLVLRNLRTLCLERCKIRDISLVGELKNLETLNFTGSNIKRLPREIGQLTHLRLLDLTDCEELIVIPPNVISRLSQLECLYMMNSFVNWGYEGQEDGRSNASLAELKSLSALSALELGISDVKVFPSDLFFKNLIRFRVNLGSYWLVSNPFPTVLRLRLDQSIALQSGINMLLKRTQYLILENCPQVLKNILDDLKKEGFAYLKGLEVYDNEEVEYLVDTMGCLSDGFFPILEKLEVVSLDSLKEICHGYLPTRSFCQLCELSLKNVPELTNLWNDRSTGDACLGNLRSVDVASCHKLKNIFSEHTARDLLQLHELRVVYCHFLEQIFANNGEVVAERKDKIVLPNLKFLELSLLDNLRSFFDETDGSSTSDGSIVDPKTQLPLFNGKVVFPVLEELHLRELPKVKDIWHPQLTADSYFCRLRVLRIIRCHSIVTVMPTYLAQSLKNLEGLSVMFCDLVEDVVSGAERPFIGNNATSAMLPCIREVLLRGLPGLMHMWWNKGPHGFLSLQNLNSLSISMCEGLGYLISCSAAKCLIRLKSLEIESCEKMKEIVTTQRQEDNEESSEAIVFPQLCTLRLYDLPNLMTFYQKRCTLEWPSLKTLTIANCPKMKSFPAYLEGNLTPITQPFFSEKVLFPDLEELHIQWMDNLVEIWHNQLPEHTFAKLKVLDIRGCHKLLDVGPINMLPRLQILEKLYIEDCDALEHVFVPEGLISQQDNVAFSLFNLAELRLKSAPKLRHIWWDNGSHVSPGFRNLNSIEISGCDDLKYVFLPSTASDLAQLKQLKVHSCKMVKEIVAEDRNSEEPRGVMVFPQAETLELENLPNLVSFCRRSCSLNWPSLKELRIVDCPRMRTFSPIPGYKSSRMNDEGSEETQMLDHLPIPVQPFFNEMVFLPTLKELRIGGLESLNELWHNQLPVKSSESFCQLKVMKLKNCEKLMKVVPSNLLPALKNLEKFSVKECDAVEEVLELEVLAAGGSSGSILASQLREVKLRNLPKLVDIWWNKNHIGTLACPNLSSLKVIKCDGLRRIFLPSVVKYFTHLQELHIADCLSMKEVVAEVGHGEYFGDRLVFPQLDSLALLNLPSMRSFCSGKYNLEWPSLKTMNLEDCPNMQAFCVGLPLTPKLDAVTVGYGKQLWKGDLNSTIQHLVEIEVIALYEFSLSLSISLSGMHASPYIPKNATITMVKSGTRNTC